MFKYSIFAVVLVQFAASSAQALVEYRIEGSATFVSAQPGLMLPPAVVDSDTVFALDFSVDETQLGTDGVFQNIGDFSGSVGPFLAFTGNGGSHTFQFLEQDAQDAAFPGDGNNFLDIDVDATSIVLQGIAAELLSVTNLGLIFESLDPLPGEQFPVESNFQSGVWAFSAEDPTGESLFVQGVVSSFSIESAPGGMDGGGLTGGGMDGGGMDGGGMDGGGMDGGGMDGGGMDGGGMDGGGMDGGGMDGGGMSGGGMDGGGMSGGGAVPEPASWLIWISLGAGMLVYRRRMANDAK